MSVRMAGWELLEKTGSSAREKGPTGWQGDSGCRTGWLRAVKGKEREQSEAPMAEEKLGGNRMCNGDF